MYWILLLFSVILFFVGLALLIGAGWTMAIFQLITQTTPSGGYEDMQKSFKGAKKLRNKTFGLLMMVGGLVLFIYSSSKI